jgi:cytochrome c peroxidase
MKYRIVVCYVSLWAAALTGCSNAQGEGDALTAEDLGGLDPETVRAEAIQKFGVLPDVQANSKRPLTDAKTTLGRQLFYEKRLSKNQDLACNTCHDLNAYGVDRRSGSVKTSLGHRGQLGTRNAPTVYNAARHVAQFWDGRAVDVEEQAKGPILNPVEMALPNAAAVVSMLKSIPGYMPLFQAAFPGVKDPITYDNVGIAIGAFERKLVTQDRFDDYLSGDKDVLSPDEVRGLYVFLNSGCPACHTGPGVGGELYRKMGDVKVYPSNGDTGRFEVTKKEMDRNVFKVPSLRNIDRTGPYFHDGSQSTLTAAIRTMSEYQTIGGKLSDDEVNSIATFLKSLTGELPSAYIKEPALLPGSATTPAPNPN